MQNMRLVATEACRRARNSRDFLRLIRRETGLPVEIIAAEEEARLAVISCAPLVSLRTEQLLVVDIGGGSTEFVLGDREVAAARSVDLGSVRLTERHLRSDPPTADEVTAAMHDVAAALDDAEAEVGFGGIATLVGLAGSVTTVAAHALGLPAYDRDAIHLA